MKTGPLVVTELTVRVVTGDTCYPGENGFSSIYAELTLDSSAVIEQLSRAQKDREPITIRCAMLDTIGKITKYRLNHGRHVFVQSIDELVYRKPGGVTSQPTV